jgi:hypothetical protein
MRNGISFLVVIIFLSGCSGKKPMPDRVYFSQAKSFANMSRCRSAGYLTSHEFSEGSKAISYTLNTWNVNEQKFKAAVTVSNDMWGDKKTTPDWCTKVKTDIGLLIAGSNSHRQKRSIEYKQAKANLAQSLHELSQMLQRSGQQALSTVQPIRVPPLSYPNSSIRSLPSPNGYEKTVVPSGTVGVLRNRVNVSYGRTLCEYSNGRAIYVEGSRNCPSVLSP